MSRYREDHFGNCPVCSQTNGCLNIGRNFWFVCHQHKTKWFAGNSLFSGWQFEPESNWLTNAALLNKYRDVEPIPPSTWRERLRLLSEQNKNEASPGERHQTNIHISKKRHYQLSEIKKAV